jgi:hypothetical protein
MDIQIDKMRLDKDLVYNITTGSFNNKSYYGYSGSVLKSGICKYFRRKQFDKFEWCVIEMMIFGLKDKGLLTNVLNRMKILLMEELVCLNLGDIHNCICIFNEIDEEEELLNKIKKILQICAIVKKINRGRIVSYINNWYKLKPVELNFETIELKKVLEFKKPNDTDELLKYGELFINFLETKDEKIFKIYDILYSLDGNFGNRYRRKDAIYLLFSIIEKKFSSDKKFLEVFEFIKIMFFRKQMKERRSFGVWLMLIVWKYERLDFNINFKIPELNDSEIIKYFENREKIIINEEYVVKDYHVNKGFGIKSFGKMGCVVIDEDLSILGNKGKEFKDFYVKSKIDTEPTKSKEPIELTGTNKNTKTLKKKIKKRIDYIVDESKLEEIPWNNFQNVKVLEAGVCGLKVCCIKVTYLGKNYILKEMKPSFRLGRDYLLIDKMKKHFKINDLGMKRIKSNIGLEIVDKKIKSFVKNWKLSEREVVYCMMEEFINIGDLGKHKYFLEQDEVFKECLKIRLYDGLLRSSDNILRNILVNKDGVLMSIDEGDIYGKRKDIFGKIDWFKKKENISKTKKVANEILEEWKVEEKIPKFKKILTKFEFNDKIEEMEERLQNYTQIVMNELN